MQVECPLICPIKARRGSQAQAPVAEPKPTFNKATAAGKAATGATQHRAAALEAVAGGSATHCEAHSPAGTGSEKVGHPSVARVCVCVCERERERVRERERAYVVRTLLPLQSFFAFALPLTVL